MRSGPWTIRHQLRVPDSCSILHPSNRTKGSNVMVNHTLKIILRVEKEESTVTAGRKKLYDIVIQTPIRILSVSLACSDLTSRIHSPFAYSVIARRNGCPFHVTTRRCGRKATPQKTHQPVRVLLAAKRKHEYTLMQQPRFLCTALRLFQ